MRPFSYLKAEGVEQATSLAVDKDKGKIIAGGTNLLDLMKYDIERPDVLVDINTLDFGKIEETSDGGLLLGALATNSDTAYHSLVQERYPLLSKAILAGASPQLRNKATNGGNLLQRTRCPYFYDTQVPCNKRVPGSGCPAKDGYSKMHAILGASESCIAVHPSDMCVALRALDAVIHVEGREGARQIPIAAFHCLPGQTPEKETELLEGDVITGIWLPPNATTHHAYFKVRERASYAFALVSVAATLTLEGDTVRSVSVALGGVAAKPWRDEAAEQMLVGETYSEEMNARFADELLREAKSYSGNKFKVPLARNAILRALRDAKQHGV